LGVFLEGGEFMQTYEPVNARGVAFPEVVEQPVMWGYHRDIHPANKYKAIVEPNTGKLFSIVSQDYRLIRHEEAIEQVDKAIDGVSNLGENEIYTEFYNDGGRMRRKYVFPDISVEIAHGDKVNPELQLYNSYDTTWPFIVILGAFRIICTNGLVVGKKYLHIQKRHVFHIDQIDLKKQVSTALNRFNLQTDQWIKWAGKRLRKETHDQVMENMKFGKNATEEIEDRINREAEDFDVNGFPIVSLWIFFNILTWYITHRGVSLNHRVELEKRLRKAITNFRGEV
jgi:hypothetical protein